LIFTRSSTVPAAHIAPAVVAVFVEAIDAGKLTSADVLAIFGAAQFAEFHRLVTSRSSSDLSRTDPDRATVISVVGVSEDAATRDHVGKLSQ